MRCLSFASSLLLILLLAGLVTVPAQGSNDANDPVMAGAILFRDTGCAHCHGMDLAGTKKGPSLADIGTNSAWTPEKIRDQILNGGKKMPPFADSLSDPEIDQIIEFLRAKNRPAVPPPAAVSTPN